MTSYDTDGVRAYAFKGSYSNVFLQFTDGLSVDFITQEFGTYPNLYVLQALRDENRYHNYGARDMKHWSKQRLREAFCLSDDTWRAKVLYDGNNLVNSAATIVYEVKMVE